jgi:hypothetical protein
MLMMMMMLLLLVVVLMRWKLVGRACLCGPLSVTLLAYVLLDGLPRRFCRITQQCENGVNVRGPDGSPKPEAQSREENVLSHGRDGWMFSERAEDLFHGCRRALQSRVRLSDQRGIPGEVESVFPGGRDIVAQRGDSRPSMDEKVGGRHDVEELGDVWIRCPCIRMDSAPGKWHNGRQDDRRQRQDLGNGHRRGEQGSVC